MSRRHLKLHTQAQIPRQLKPQRIDARVLYNAAVDAHRTGNMTEALRLYQAILKGIAREHPMTVRVTFLTSLCCYQLRIYDEAIMLMELCRAVDFNNPLVHYNLGIIYDAVNRREDSAEAYRVATLLDPENKAATNNLGNVLRHLGDLEGAERCYQDVIDAQTEDPQARYNRSHIKLVRGDLAGGFADYEYRWKCDGWVAEYGRSHLNAPTWTKDRAPERVYIWAEQGFGDSIQFSRYVPMVHELGHTVIFETEPHLLSLFKQLEQRFDRLTVISRQKTPPDHDSHIPLLSLPAAFGTSIDTVPPVLSLDPPVPCPVPLPNDGQLRVGLVWAGNPNHHNDLIRSATIDALAPMFSVPLVHWFNLQLAPRAGDFNVDIHARLASSGHLAQLHEVSGYLRSFADTAALIRELDIVVAVDTAVAHLSATLGTETWLMLPHIPEWRWLEQREDSPWYPAIRLWRQDGVTGWAGVAERIAHALTDRLRAEEAA